MKILKFLTLGILAASLTACGVAGPKGEKGDQGIPGQTGPQGPAGQDGTDGQDGKDGVDGQDGKDGTDGLPGTDGATWLTGEQDPNNEDGKNGDLYLNTITFDIFLKSNGIWSKIGNIKGKDGIDGTDGVDGQDGKDGIDGIDGVNGQDGKDGTNGLPGTDGATWLTGLEDPSNGDGKNGDLYLNTTSSDIFTKVNGEWVKIGNIKGNPGENGHDADTYGRVHTVTFDAGEGELINYEETIQVNYGETIELPLAKRDAYIFTGWYTGFGVNDGKFTNVTPVTRDLTLYAGWEEDIKFSVFFNTNGGSTIAPQVYSALSTINSLPEPTKTDYTFAGWYLDDGFNDRFATPYIITSDIDVYAKWEIAHYTVYFETNGGDPISSLDYVAGDNVTGLIDANKQYKQFAGWYFDSQFNTPFEDGYEIHSNITLYAKFNDTYSTITFESNGGSIVSSKNVMNGTDVTSLTTPTRLSYQFLGWYLDSELNNKIVLPYLVTKNFTLYAKWQWVDPWAGYTKITTLSQLNNISNMSGKYVLMNDIDCGGSGVKQIGTTSSPFTGEFNGDGHTISNFTINKNASETLNFGLFGVNQGLIKGLKISTSTDFGLLSDIATSENSYQINVGGIVGTNKGTINSCSVDGDIYASYIGTYQKTSWFRVGGIAGKNDEESTITNCVFKGNLSATNNTKTSGTSTNYCYSTIGGIAGLNDGSISYCALTGLVSALNPNTSLGTLDIFRANTYLSGITRGGNISKCLVLRDLSGSNVHYGANIANNSNSPATIQNCFYFEDVTFPGSTKKTDGTSKTKSEINSNDLYSVSLGFNSNIWNYSSLNYDNGVYVDLK